MKIYALNTLESGGNLIDQIRDDIPLQGIIGLGEMTPSESISGYVFMEPFARERGMDFISVGSYGLMLDEDRKAISALDIDALIICGWQRLIPGWLIEKANSRVIGAHGSSSGITGGRGRSPQNWALILGAKSFEVSIFFVDESIDSGDVIATQRYPLEDRDDIGTSYKKCVQAVAGMLIESFKSGAIQNRRSTPQSGQAFYYPQRIPADGAIDWHRSATDINLFVRALTHPYPGARSRVAGTEITVWRARPQKPETGAVEALPGQIVHYYPGGSIVVCTGEGCLLVEEYEVSPSSDSLLFNVGITLQSVDFKSQMREIVARHQANHPDLAVSPDILAVAGLGS